jgi:hypothetical protein
MRQKWIAVLLAGFLVEGAACAGRHTSKTSPSEETVVVVRNGNWLDAVVYAVRGATRIRLGSVTGLNTTTFKFPTNYSPDGTFQLLVDPIGSSTVYMSNDFVVTPGQHVELSIAPALSMSTVAVWSSR